MPKRWVFVEVYFSFYLVSLHIYTNYFRKIVYLISHCYKVDPFCTSMAKSESQSFIHSWEVHERRFWIHYFCVRGFSYHKLTPPCLNCTCEAQLYFMSTYKACEAQLYFMSTYKAGCDVAVDNAQLFSWSVLLKRPRCWYGMAPLISKYIFICYIDISWSCSFRIKQYWSPRCTFSHLILDISHKLMCLFTPLFSFTY